MVQASLAQLVKLGSIARHVEELLEPGGHPVDEDAIRSLLGDPDVVRVLGDLDGHGLLPVKR